MKAKSYVSLFLLLLLVCTAVTGLRASAADGSGEVIRIYTAEDLLRIADNPSGNYLLMSDIDLSGVEWPAITFSGRFDGNNHILLNLNKPAVSTETRVTYDGNRKTYDTVFCGLFALLEHAEVKNVRLLGVDIFTDIEADCFVGGIAGFASESIIENCEVSGTLRLDVTGKMFGVGGIIGYGNSVVRSCKADVTLINIDKDASTRDEEFLGGICAAGYPDMDGNTVSIKGFLSDHGYVHSGGLVGMYIVYPKRFQRDGFIKNNTLEGFITFFEDNTNRRAYCEKQCGEIMDWVFSDSGNVYHFTRDERKTYNVNLLPHGDCKDPAFDVSELPASCTEPGKTMHMCRTCGYTYFDNYVLPVHTPSETYTTVTESTLTEQGIAEYTCTECGALFRGFLPLLTPTPTPLPTEAPTPTAVPDETAPASADRSAPASGETGMPDWVLPAAIAGVCVLAAVLLCIVILREKSRRSRRNRFR